MTLFPKSKIASEPPRSAPPGTAPTQALPQPNWKSAQQYTYDDLLRLLRDLSPHRREMVLRIFIKTLRSARMDPSVFLEQGYQRLESLKERNERLAREIEDIESLLHDRRFDLNALEKERELLMNLALCFALARKS